MGTIIFLIISGLRARYRQTKQEVVLAKAVANYRFPQDHLIS